MDDYGFHPSAAIVCDVSSESEGVEKLIRLGIGMKCLEEKSDRNDWCKLVLYFEKIVVRCNFDILEINDSGVWEKWIGVHSIMRVSFLM